MATIGRAAWAGVRRPMSSSASWARKGALLVGLCGLAAAFSVSAAKPGGPPGSGGTTSLNPDIVYMSASSNNFSTAEVRGVTLSVDRATATDSSLFKAASGREIHSVAWSPDGRRFAWIENGRILAAAPGAKPTVLYPTDSTDPRVTPNPDALAWAPDCARSGGSVLAFHSGNPYGIQLLKFDGNGALIDRELLYDNPSVEVEPNVWVASASGSFAFSPSGQHLAFYASSYALQPGIWTIAMCPIPGDAARGEPNLLVPKADLKGFGTDPVMSVDWSNSGQRIAVSVVTSTDPGYPWRNLRVVDLAYSRSGDGRETFGYGSVRTLDALAEYFGSESSEHSPQWDPSPAGEACERLAFSQSSDAGRKLFLVDLVTGTGCSGVPQVPRQIAGKTPRALDWKSK